MPEEIIRQYLFDRPGHYQIRVFGTLEPCWLDHLEELQISISSWSNNYPVTLISGWLSDQTALAGLLELLNDLGMVILTVERLENHLIERLNDTERQEERPENDQETQSK